MQNITECQACGQALRLPSIAEAKKARCPSCGSEFMLEGLPRPQCQTSPAIPQVRIFLTDNTNRHVVFTHSTVEFEGVSISFHDIVGVSFTSSKTSTNFTDSAGFFVCIRSASGSCINIRESSTKVSLFGKEIKTNYGPIVSELQNRIAASLCERLINAIFSDSEEVKIGAMKFDSNGITTEGFLGGRKRVPWTSRPEARYVTRENYLTCSTKSGVIEISYCNPHTSKMTVIGRASSADENGFLLPYICAVVNQAF